MRSQSKPQSFFPSQRGQNGEGPGGGQDGRPWALITGATSGFGRATAYRLAESYNLILTGRREERLEEIQGELSHRTSGPRTQVVTGAFDLRSVSQVMDFMRRPDLEDLLPQVEVLINNAGLARGRSFFQDTRDPGSSWEDWETMIDTNLKGLILMTRSVLPYMVKKNSGHIVNVGSVSGQWVYPKGAVYCATKYAVRALTEGLRMDLMGHNIRVTHVAPGMANTEFSMVRLGAEQAQGVYDGMTPLSAEDIAETIVWVLSRPRHVNIQEIVLFPTDQASVHHVFRSIESSKG